MSAADFSQQLDQNATSGGEFNIFDWFENNDTKAASSPEVETAETEDEEGYFIDASIRRLFKLLWEGYPVQDFTQLDLQSSQEAIHNTFRLPALKSHLFDL